jgi:hypothetical protein
MKRYEAWRDLAGAHVLVDDAPLDPRLDLAALSPAGFEWTYVGAGPAQLALALLAHHWGDGERALQHYRRFMETVVAFLPNDWEMTAADLDAAIAQMNGAAVS